MAALRIKTLNSQIEPCYSCRLCPASAYVDDSAEVRTKDPTRPGQDLGWLNCRLCMNCSNVLDVAFRFDKADPSSPYVKQDTFDLKKSSEKDDNALQQFLKRKQEMNSSLNIAEEDGAEVTRHRRQTINLVEGETTEEVLYSFFFYKWAEYQADPALGNKTNAAKAGSRHVEMAWKGECGVASFNNTKGVHVTVKRFQENSKETCLATTLNGQEVVASEFKHAQEDLSSFPFSSKCVCTVSKDLNQTLDLACGLASPHTLATTCLPHRTRGFFNHGGQEYRARSISFGDRRNCRQ